MYQTQKASKVRFPTIKDNVKNYFQSYNRDQIYQAYFYHDYHSAHHYLTLRHEIPIARRWSTWYNSDATYLWWGSPYISAYQATQLKILFKVFFCYDVSPS
jgi:hypothetical protein